MPTAEEGEEHETGGIVWLKYANVDGALQGFLASGSVGQRVGTWHASRNVMGCTANGSVSRADDP